MLNSSQLRSSHFTLRSLVLRHTARRRSLTVPTHHDCRLSAAGALHLLLHIRAVLDILPEIADMAADLLVGLERERDDRDEAECEPFPGCVSTLSMCRRKCGVRWVWRKVSV